MALLSRKGLLAIAAVIDVALHGRGRPVSAKALAARHALPARHLEPVLQALVRVGILKGIRGPRGGYELARERRRITADDILRAAGTIEDVGEPRNPASALLNSVVIPGGRPGRAGVLGRAQPHQPRRAGAARRAAQRLDRRPPRAPTPHPAFIAAFTIWTLSARFRLSVKSQ